MTQHCRDTNYLEETPVLFSYTLYLCMHPNCIFDPMLHQLDVNLERKLAPLLEELIVAVPTHLCQQIICRIGFLCKINLLTSVVEQVWSSGQYMGTIAALEKSFEEKCEL